MANILEQWENQFQLPEEQRLFALRLQDELSERTMPEHLSADDDSKSPQLTPLESTKDSTHTSFMSAYEAAEQEMLKEEEHAYHVHLNSLQHYRQEITRMQDNVSNVLKLTETLQENYTFVESKSSALQQTCEKLMDEQVHLSRISAYMSDKLSYFNELEKISRLFNGPGEDVCLNDMFVPMLSRLDECIDFVQKHLRYKDAELYLMRFRQCMTRGMSLIKLLFSAVINGLLYDLQKQTSTGSSDFVKFRALAPSMQPLLAEIESRCEDHQEYFSLLRDCYNVYFAARRTLLLPSIRETIYKISSKDSLSIARDGCSHMLGAAKDELQLFRMFFTSGDEELSSYLEQLCGPLYDTVCPLIIQENSIDVLASLCQLIRGIVPTNLPETLIFQHIMDRIAHDAQARLVFRAQSYLRYDLQQFTPTLADLNYPAKLAMQMDDSETIDRYCNWYPAMYRTLYLLSKLYLSVNQSIFEDMSQEALSICLESLRSAFQTLKPSKGPIDAQLFLIKHLLALREQISPFGSEFLQSHRLLDFTGLYNTVTVLWANKSSILQSGLMGLVQRGIPSVVEETLNAKQDIDICLKKTCEALIIDAHKYLCEALTSFLVKCSAFKLRQEKLRLRDQSFATDAQVTVAYDSFCGKLDRGMYEKIHTYINDENTESILHAAIKSHVVETYRMFMALLAVDYETSLYSAWYSKDTLKEKLDQVFEKSD